MQTVIELHCLGASFHLHAHTHLMKFTASSGENKQQQGGFAFGLRHPMQAVRRRSRMLLGAFQACVCFRIGHGPLRLLSG